MNPEDQEAIDRKFTIPVMYKWTKYFVAECIRESLLGQLNPDYELKIYNMESRQYIHVAIKYLHF